VSLGTVAPDPEDCLFGVAGSGAIAQRRCAGRAARNGDLLYLLWEAQVISDRRRHGVRSPADTPCHRFRSHR
jgi:hypothetical protein